jgi:hypothetical protein
LFTNGGTCLLDIVHSALWGSKYPVCTPDTQVLFLTLVGHVCCIHNILQYRLTPAEYRQPKLPSFYQRHHLVLRHLSQVVKNPPCLGIKTGTSRTRVRHSNHYTIELLKSCYKLLSNTRYAIIHIICNIFIAAEERYNVAELPGH